MNDERPAWDSSNDCEEAVGVFESILRRKCSIDAARAVRPLRGWDVEVSVVESATQRAAADRLLAKRYAWRGYANMGETFPGLTKGALRYFTLLASRDDSAVGTLTLGVDSPAGLVVDEASRDIVDGLRRIGRRVVELRRLALEDEVDPKAVLANLFQTAYKIGCLSHRATDVLIEVNPRHAAYYQRIFGFTKTGREWICPRVDAPAVLMHLDLTNLDRKFRSLYEGGKTLAPAAVESCARARATRSPR